jgi:hypothetical protein
MLFLRRSNRMKADSTVLRCWWGAVLGWDQCRSTRSTQWRSVDTRIGKRADGIAGPSIVDDDR